jgi:short subunit dehydrogenase-like uncharacterized protein
MIEACLLAGVNYLDITGEIEVIELVAQQHQRAVKAGVSLMPAVGFDVVPSDCLAAQLSAAQPTASELRLAISTQLSISPGTAKTVFAQLPHGGRVRADGHIVRVPVAHETTRIRFPSGARQAVSVPWGDVSSAFHTTGIPDIHVYFAMPSKMIRSLRRWRWLLPLTRFGLSQRVGRRWIERYILGPPPNERAIGRAELWGRVTTPGGNVAEATLVTPEGYTLTAEVALEILNRTLAGEVGPGFSTPAKTFGGEFIKTFDGVRCEWRT